MSSISIRPLARIDLAEIWDYIAEDSESQADAFIDKIDNRFHMIASQPDIGRIRNELAEDLRSFPVGKYVIFYLTILGGIEIVRVLHGARDIYTIFNPDDDD